MKNGRDEGGGKGQSGMRLSLKSWDKNVRGREALSSSQEKIQGCGAWVGGVEVAQQTRGASHSEIPA